MSATSKPRAKFSVLVLVLDHYDTFRNYDSRKISPSDYLIYVGIPGLAALLIDIFRLRASNAADILAAVAVLTGLIFNAVLLVSDLSARAHEVSDQDSRRTAIMQLAGELRANISYAVLLGLALSAILGGIDMFTDTTKPLSITFTMIVIALGIQLLLTILMILKRLRSLFESFGIDRNERTP